MSAKIDKLYKKSLRIIERDINHLFNLVIGEKLNPDYAMDLSRYVKLLADMKKAQDAALASRIDKAKKAAKDVSDEALEEALKDKGE